MRGECTQIHRKIKKEKHHKRKAMIATQSDEESDSSTQSKSPDENLCLMDHEGNTYDVTSNSKNISNEQWEEAYEMLYEKFKTLRHGNKLLKNSCANNNNYEENLKNCHFDC